MNYKDVDPKVKRLFPWALFLVLAALFAFAATRVHAEEDVWACYGSARYEAMSSAWTPCNEMSRICIKVREYISQGHTIEEGRVLAQSKHIPQWIIKKAERCLP
jgi:hypothetical protein